MEQIYNIPLRKEYQKAPRYKKSGKAMRAIKEFVAKHTKSENIKVGKHLNELIWKNGPKNPPHKVNVRVTKEEDVTKVELVGAPVEEVPEPQKKKNIEKEVKEEVKEELQKDGMKKEVAEKVAEEIKEESGKEIVKEVTKEKPKKKEKVPTAEELAKKKEKKEVKKVPTVNELKEKKNSKKD